MGIMTGTITKKHFFQIVRALGWKVAIRILLKRGRTATALNILMGGK